MNPNQAKSNLNKLEQQPMADSSKSSEPKMTQVRMITLRDYSGKYDPEPTEKHHCLGHPGLAKHCWT